MKSFLKDRLQSLGIILVVVAAFTGTFNVYVFYHQKSHLIADYNADIQADLEAIRLLVSEVLTNDCSQNLDKIFKLWITGHRQTIALEVVLDTNQVLFSHNKGEDKYSIFVTTTAQCPKHQVRIALARSTIYLSAILSNLGYDLALLTLSVTSVMGFALWLLLFRWLINPMQAEIRRQTTLLRDTVAYTEELFNAMKTHIAILDSNGIIISTNKAWQVFASNNGYQDDPAMIGQSYVLMAKNLYQYGKHEAWEAKITELILDLRIQYTCEYGCVDRGKKCWFIMRALPVPRSSPPLLIVTHEDITSIKETQLALSSSESQLKQINKVYQALSASNILLSKAKLESELVQGVADIIYANCENLAVCIGYISEAATHQLEIMAFKGFNQGQMDNLAHSWNDHTLNHMVAKTSIHEQRPVIFDNSHGTALTLGWCERAGSPNPSACAAFPLLYENRCLGIILTHSDTRATFSKQEILLFNELATNLAFGILALRNRQEKEQAIQALNQLSITDKLTQIYNRAKLDWVLEDQVKQFRMHHQFNFSIILTDIDHFKRVNDTYGHQTGDQVLIHFASIIKDNLRSSDIIGRWGGEEFLIICPHTKLSGAKLLANKLCHVLYASTIETVGKITASFGVAEFISEDNVDSILGRADQALYKAKESGRNTVVAADK